MKISNYSSLPMYVNGVDVSQREITLPTSFTGTILVGTENISYSTESFEITVVSSGTGLIIDETTLPDPPIWMAMVLMVTVFGFNMIVRVLNKLRMA